MATFVLNDENVENCYGFRIRNAGIDLTRFKANPVMLDDHRNSTDAVLGRWKNIRVEGSCLLADDDFDVEDERANKIKGKVDRGMIKGCSMGISFDSSRMERKPDDSYELVESELAEASIVAVPGNANSLRLYATDGTVLTSEAVKLQLSALPQTVTDPNLFPKPETPSKGMKGANLSFNALQALGFQSVPENVDDMAISTHIETTNAALKVAQAENATLKTTLADTQKAVSKGMLNRAVLTGQILETERSHYEKLAASDMDLCIATLAKIPAKKSLGNQIDNPAGDASDPKTMEEFQKLSHEAQLAFKNNNPAGYKKILE